jgi:poly-gamma-glutamate synthesis protein (capsule biosynthesis protein)
MQIFQTIWIVALSSIVMTSCQGNVPRSLPETAMPATSPPPSASEIEPSVVPTADIMSIETSAPAQRLVLTPTPEHTPIIKPITISAGSGIPSAIVRSSQELATEKPDQFRWSENNGDLRLVWQDGLALASWHFAVVTPFPTIADNIELEALKNAWRRGSLHTDPETAALLVALWGEPASQLAIVDADTDTLVDLLWNVREGYDRPPLAVVPFDRLDPRLKVLRIGDISPVDVDYDSSQYPLAVSIGITGTAEHTDEFIASWIGPKTNRDDNQITHLAMTGPAGMRRAVAD